MNTKEHHEILTPIHKELICRIEYTKNYAYDYSISEEWRRLTDKKQAYEFQKSEQKNNPDSLPVIADIFTVGDESRLKEIGETEIKITNEVRKVEFIEVLTGKEPAHLKTLPSIPIAHWNRIQKYVDTINNDKQEPTNYNEYCKA